MPTKRQHVLRESTIRFVIPMALRRFVPRREPESIVPSTRFKASAQDVVLRRFVKSTEKFQLRNVGKRLFVISIAKSIRMLQENAELIRSVVLFPIRRNVVNTRR